MKLFVTYILSYISLDLYQFWIFWVSTLWLTVVIICFSAVYVRPILRSIHLKLGESYLGLMIACVTCLPFAFIFYWAWCIAFITFTSAACCMPSGLIALCPTAHLPTCVSAAEWHHGHTQPTAGNHTTSPWWRRPYVFNPRISYGGIWSRSVTSKVRDRASGVNPNYSEGDDGEIWYDNGAAYRRYRHRSIPVSFTIKILNHCESRL